MNVFVLLLISFAASLGGSVCSKLCSNAVVGHSKGRYAVFMVVNGIIACIFFFVSGGFRLEANMPTLIYAAIYTVIVVFSLVSNMIALKYINIVALTVVINTLGLIASSAVGAWLFNETVDGRKIARIAIMLVSVVLFAADGVVGKKKEKDSRKFSLMAVIIIIVMLAVNCANTVVTKYYALDTRVVGENSFFFFTNVFLIVASAVVVIFELIRSPEEIKKVTPLFRPLNLLALSGNTVCSNIGSLVSLLLLAQMEVSVLSPISSALGILVGFIGSLIFREKLGVLSYLGVLGALAAVII